MKTCLNISLTLGLLVLSGLFLSCQKGVALHSEAKHYPHEHLQPPALEPRAQLDTVDYKLTQGETLANVARLRYGHQNYYRIIKLYNHLEDEARVTADAKLRLPDISVILVEEGLNKVAAQEMALILCSRAKYDKVVDHLWVLRRKNTQLPEDIKRELLEAADDLQQATESLKQSKPGVTGVPARMIGQLDEAMSGMRVLAEGHFDSYGYDVDLVQQRYALALTYGIIWAREGFK